MIFGINVNKWLLWTVETMYFDVVEPVFLYLQNRLLSWATVLISSHPAMGKHNVACQHSQQTRDVDPMLVQFWPTVCDAGPASNQHWFNALCSLGCGSRSAYCWGRVQANTDPISVKLLADVAGADR